jgi:capsular exopolysaccharide synthesis family protein
MRIPRSNVEIVEPAHAPDEDDPDSPNFLLNIIVSIVLGMGAGVGLAFFVEYLDTSVKTLDEVERRLGTSVIGVIPQKVKPFTDPGADPAHGEAYRMLRTNIQFSRKVQGGKTFCLTSGSVGEGKSLTAFNLAWVSAQLGDRVLLVDADLHRPRQHKILKLSNSRGLADVLMGNLSLEEAIAATSMANMDVLLSGRVAPGAHGLLDTRRLKELVEALRQSYDMILFDAPPVIGVSDASLIVREVDGVILVVQHRKYPFSVSLRAKAIIDNLGANLVGVVLNNINVSRDYSYYYYHHHYYSYPQAKGDEGKKA